MTDVSFDVITYGCPIQLMSIDEHIGVFKSLFVPVVPSGRVRRATHLSIHEVEKRLKILS